MIHIFPERPKDAADVEALLDLVFRTDRRERRTIYRLRDGIPPLRDLCFVAREEGALRASLRFWPISIGGRAGALLLGPLAVAPGHQGRGLGADLVRHGLAAARTPGHRRVVLVGDLGYFGRFGFDRSPVAGMRLPYGVAEPRLLGAALVSGAFDGVGGILSAGGPGAQAPSRRQASKSPPRINAIRRNGGRRGTCATPVTM